MTKKRERDRSLDPSRVLTVDPGRWAAGCLWEVRDMEAVRQPSVFRVDGDDPRAIQLLLRRTRAGKLVVEAAYPPRLMSFGGMRTFFRRQSHWVTLARLHRIPFEEVAPTTWQSKVPGWINRMKRAELNVLYTSHARVVSGRDLSEDEAAAYCLGLWYMGVRGTRLEG